jgi:hypothetical protein
MPLWERIYMNGQERTGTREWRSSVSELKQVTQLPDGQKIDWSRAEVDSESKRAVMGSHR